MDEQIGRDRISLALVQQPRAQRLDKAVRGSGPQVRQRLQGPTAQILGRLGVGAQHDLDQMFVGVDAAGSTKEAPGPNGAFERSPRQ